MKEALKHSRVISIRLEIDAAASPHDAVLDATRLSINEAADVTFELNGVTYIIKYHDLLGCTKIRVS